jgi:hypothetical protein
MALPAREGNEFKNVRSQEPTCAQFSEAQLLGHIASRVANVKRVIAAQEAIVDCDPILFVEGCVVVKRFHGAEMGSVVAGLDDFERDPGDPSGFLLLGYQVLTNLAPSTEVVVENVFDKPCIA